MKEAWEDLPNTPWRFVPWFFFLICWGATAYGGWISWQLVQNNQQGQFIRLVEEAEQALKNRMSDYQNALWAGKGFVNSIPSLNRTSWRDFVMSLPLQHSFSGINGLGVIYHLKAEEIETFVREKKAEETADFKIKSLSKQAQEQPTSHEYIITYIEPIERNLPAVGLDIRSESTRRIAAEEAIKTGQPTLTGKIKLVQDDSQSNGFLLLLPFYQKGMHIETEEQRQGKRILN